MPSNPTISAPANGNGNPANELMQGFIASQSMNGGPMDTLTNNTAREAALSQWLMQRAVQTGLGQQLNADDPDRLLTTNTTVRGGENMNGSVAPEYMAGLGSRATVPAIARALRQGTGENAKGNPAFDGVSEEYIREQLQYIVEMGRGKINPQQAAAILERSMFQRDQGKLASGARNLRSIFQAINPLDDSRNDSVDLGGGRAIDYDQVNRLVNDVTTNEVVDQTNEQSRLGDVSSRLQAARADLDATRRELTHMTQVAQGGDPKAAELAQRLSFQVQEKTNILAMLRAEYGANENNTSRSFRVD